MGYQLPSIINHLIPSTKTDNYRLMVLKYLSSRNQKIKIMKVIYFIAILLIIGLSQSVKAQPSSTDLKRLFEAEKYENAISHLEVIEYSDNSESLIIIGDCLMAVASVDANNALNNYNTLMSNSVKFAAMGVYDNTSLYTAMYYESLRRVTEKRIKALSLYEKAYKLGNEKACVRINQMQNNKVNINNQPSIYNNITTTPVINQHKTRTCSVCNGSGHVHGTVAVYSSMTEKWCDGCQRMVPASHCHNCKTCPACNGRGSY